MGKGWFLDIPYKISQTKNLLAKRPFFEATRLHPTHANKELVRHTSSYFRVIHMRDVCTSRQHKQIYIRITVYIVLAVLKLGRALNDRLWLKNTGSPGQKVHRLFLLSCVDRFGLLKMFAAEFWFQLVIDDVTSYWSKTSGASCLAPSLEMFARPSIGLVIRCIPSVPLIVD